MGGNLGDGGKQNENRGLTGGLWEVGLGTGGPVSASGRGEALSALQLGVTVGAGKAG